MRNLIALAALLMPAAAMAQAQSPAMTTFLADKNYDDGVACTFDRNVAACDRKIAKLDSYIKLPTATAADREHFYNLLWDTYGERARGYVEKGTIADAVRTGEVARARMLAWIDGREDGRKYRTGWILAMSFQTRHALALFAAGRHAEARAILTTARANAVRSFTDASIVSASQAYYPWRTRILNSVRNADSDLVLGLTQIIAKGTEANDPAVAALRLDGLAAFDNSLAWLRRIAPLGVDTPASVAAQQVRLIEDRGRFLADLGDIPAAGIEFRRAGTLAGCKSEDAYRRLNLPPPPPPPPPGTARLKRAPLPQATPCDSIASGWAKGRDIMTREISPRYLAELRANPVSIAAIVGAAKK